LQVRLLLGVAHSQGSHLNHCFHRLCAGVFRRCFFLGGATDGAGAELDAVLPPRFETSLGLALGSSNETRHLVGSHYLLLNSLAR
jgi:hypothetical protein